jgi:hypothetical protein
MNKNQIKEQKNTMATPWTKPQTKGEKHYEQCHELKDQGKVTSTMVQA